MSYFWTVIALFFTITLNAQKFEMDTLLWNGSSDNRVNIVILGDGYQQSELDKFTVDAQNVFDKLFIESPYKEYKNFFNVVIVKVPSNESGANHPGTARDVDEPVHPVIEVDNYFGSSFDLAGIHRLLSITKTVTLSNVLADNFPAYDEALILVNTEYYGGAGGKYAVCSTDQSAAAIAIHELGHSFASLADEYYAGDRYAREDKNMTQITSTDSVKWKNWLGEKGTAIHQHCCGGNSSEWYKPNKACKMQRLNGKFCPVCSEGTIEEIHALVEFIDDFSPANNGNIQASDDLEFEITTVNPIPNTLSVKWTLNGADLKDSTNQLVLPKDSLLNGENTLQVAVVDETALIRKDNYKKTVFSSVLWTIDAITTTVKDVVRSSMDVAIGPNPFGNQLTLNFIKTVQEDYTVAIHDVTGRKLVERSFSAGQQNVSIETGKLVPNVYILKITLDNGIQYTQKLIKK